MISKQNWRMTMVSMAAVVCVLAMAPALVLAQEAASASNQGTAAAARPVKEDKAQESSQEKTQDAAQNDNAANKASDNAADKTDAKTDAKSATGDSAADVMNKLVNQMKKSPLVEPSSSTPNDKANAQKTPTYQPVRVGVDPNIIGTAPGAKPPALRREGEFVISRKGRLVRSADGLHTLLVFDADSKDSAEPPMAVVPCQMLQSMEDLLGQRGEQIRFIISGQILVYRGVNYILPTMMTLAEDRGNLQ